MSQTEESKSRNCESDHGRWYLLLWKDNSIHLFRKMLQLNMDYQPVGNFKCMNTTMWKHKLKQMWVGQRMCARRWITVLFFPDGYLSTKLLCFMRTSMLIVQLGLWFLVLRVAYLYPAQGWLLNLWGQGTVDLWFTSLSAIYPQSTYTHTHIHT